MKQFIKAHAQKIAGFAACLLIAGIMMSFQDTPFVNQIIDNRPDVKADTIPMRQDNAMKMEEFDRIIETLDEDRLVNLTLPDLDKIQLDVENSMKDLDMTAMLATVEKSLASIDVDQIMKDVELSLNDKRITIDTMDIRISMAEARKELEEARAEMRNINTDEIRKEMAEARKEIDKARIELKNIDVEKIRGEARKGIQEAKEELMQTKAMFLEMEKDGIIKIDDGFTIEFTEDALIVNGVKQSAQTLSKYRKYIKDKDFKIRIIK